VQTQCSLMLYHSAGTPLAPPPPLPALTGIENWRAAQIYDNALERRVTAELQTAARHNQILVRPINLGQIPRLGR